MRRKAEILKHSGVSQNTKTNGLTKFESWAQLAKGTTSLSQYAIMNANCSAASLKENILTPTSSCDVPGPVMYLINDPSVPLYNYATNTRAYGIVNQSNIINWQIETMQNTFTDGVASTLFILYIQPAIANPVYTYTLRTPVSIFAQGTASSADISIQDVILGVYYNGGLVIQTKPIVYTHTFTNLAITAAGDFSATQYAGMLTVSNIFLLTQPTYVYDFKLTFSLPTTPYVQVGVICAYENNATNCTTNGPSTESQFDQMLIGI